MTKIEDLMPGWDHDKMQRRNKLFRDIYHGCEPAEDLRLRVLTDVLWHSTAMIVLALDRLATPVTTPKRKRK
jgi:hypothetical protein